MTAMSAIGTKRTLLFAPHMSAFGGKADISVLIGGAERNESRRLGQQHHRCNAE